ncbi:hypothetical protein ON010_g13271 [Phytophthora cinnamomi]|nr:hypothetical protein ON010_g13271 [Phytophthora cinnamomi]
MVTSCCSSTPGFGPDAGEDEHETEEEDAAVEMKARYKPNGCAVTVSGENVGDLLRGASILLVEGAIFGGQLGTLEWTIENGYEDKSAYMYLVVRPAIDPNRLDVVAFLIYNNVRRDEAARNGHLAVVKWLHGQAKACRTIIAMDSAASYGCQVWLSSGPIQIAGRAARPPRWIVLLATASLALSTGFARTAQKAALLSLWMTPKCSK